MSCNKLLHKYSLPNIYTVKTEFQSESQFKQQVKTKVDKYIKDSWLSSTEEKKSVSFLNVEGCSVGNVHPCWSTVDNTVMDVRRAVIKARILTGTYYLQADRDKFQKEGITSMCPLCSATSEDRLHFLGLTKQRKEHSFRERKIFIRKEHFIALLPVLNNFKCLFLHQATYI